MEKKTHIVCANALALSIVRPTTMTSLLITVGSASIGSILSDVDVKDSIPDKLFDRLMVSLITIICLGLVLKYIFNVDIYNMLMQYNKYFSYFLSIGIFITMAFLGSKTPHRSFTHSLFGCFIYTTILSYGFGLDVLIPFVVAFISHIVLDLFNMIGVAILYPSKYRISFKLCESSGKVNDFLFYLFLSSSSFERKQILHSSLFTLHLFVLFISHVCTYIEVHTALEASLTARLGTVPCATGCTAPAASIGRTVIGSLYATFDSSSYSVSRYANGSADHTAYSTSRCGCCRGGHSADG